MKLDVKQRNVRRVASLVACAGIGLSILLFTRVLTESASSWRLKQEMLAADSEESVLRGLQLLGVSAVPMTDSHDPACSAQPAADLDRFALEGHIILLDRGTRVSTLENGKPMPAVQKIAILDGPHAGEVWWLYPQSAKSLGFSELPKHSPIDLSAH